MYIYLNLPSVFILSGSWEASLTWARRGKFSQLCLPFQRLLFSQGPAVGQSSPSLFPCCGTSLTQRRWEPAHLPLIALRTKFPPRSLFSVKNMCSLRRHTPSTKTGAGFPGARLENADAKAWCSWEPFRNPRMSCGHPWSSRRGARSSPPSPSLPAADDSGLGLDSGAVERQCVSAGWWKDPLPL